MIVSLLVLPRYESHHPPTLLPRWSLIPRWPNRDRSLMCVRRSWIDTRNGIRDLRTCRYRKFCGVVGARGVGPATIDGGVGGGGRSTGRSCRNCPTFAGFLGTRSDTCLRSSEGVHPARSLCITHPYYPVPHKHSWPVQVGCSVPALVFYPFCQVLRCGHRNICVTEHPETGGYDSFWLSGTNLLKRCLPRHRGRRPTQTLQRSAEQTTRHPLSSRFEPAQPHDTSPSCVPIEPQPLAHST